jgi:hypothetical protein
MAQDPTYCANPLQKAKYWVRFEEQNRNWTFANWTVSKTTSGTLEVETNRNSRQTLIGDPANMTGLSGMIAGGHFFTARYDWDTTHGFHVNAMRGNQTRHFAARSQATGLDRKIYAVQRYDVLTDKISHLGDAEAANWFMSDMLVWESDSVTM